MPSFPMTSSSPPPKKIIAVVNGTGRQAASLVRVASAIGYAVRAQVHALDGLVAQELQELPNVTLIDGPLLDDKAQVNRSLIEQLFHGAHLAFINTTSQAGDEVAIGKALAQEAKKSKTMQHYIYSSMPDHSIHNHHWPALPFWSCKFTVENYIRQLGLPATFVYTGIYNNNFTSLPYPLFCMELQDDGSFEWRAPFHPHIPLPWLDAEHDVGPAVIQIFKDGPKRWKDHRIALAFELLTPLQVCAAFQRALGRPCHYARDPRIEIRVPTPSGYREQLQGIEVLFGQMHAPYFPGDDWVTRNSSGISGSPDKGRERGKGLNKARINGEIAGGARGGGVAAGESSSHHIALDEARTLWEGWRGMEEYAREVFPIEEEANGLDWMI